MIACINRLARLLERPNSHELRESENVAKKLIPKTNVGNLIVHFRAHFIELLLAIQLVGRAVVTGRVTQTGDLERVVVELLGDTRTNPMIRKNLIHLIAILVVKIAKPDSLLVYMSTVLASVPDTVTLSILEEIPSVSPVTDSDKQTLNLWGKEVFVFAMSRKLVDVVEKWIERVDGVTINQSSLISSLHVEDVESFEDTLVKCCAKPELTSAILRSVIVPLLESDKVRHWDSACKLFAELSMFDVEVLHEVLLRLGQILGHVRVPDRLTLIESILAFFDHKTITLDQQVFEFLVVISSFPSGVEADFPLIGEGSLDNTVFPEELLQRMTDIRQDVRNILRSSREGDAVFHDRLNQTMHSIPTISDWRIAESLLHAMSGLTKKYPHISPGLLLILVNHSRVETTHRAVLCSLIVLSTTTMSLMDEDTFRKCISLVLVCLASIDTLDPTGWFPFRSKQDNSCVVFLQTVAMSRRSVQWDSCAEVLTSHSTHIKDRLYHRNPFRQSRNIFVSSIAQIAAHNAPSPSTTLPDLLARVCDDCEDIATFISSVDSHKDAFRDIVRQRLDGFLSTNATGAEVLVSVYADWLGLAGVESAIRLSVRSPNFHISRWLMVASKLTSVHGSRFVLFFTPLLRDVPLKYLPSEWFSECLMAVPIEGHEQFHIELLQCVMRSPIPSDLFKSVANFAIHSLTSLFKNNVSVDIILPLTVELTVSLIRQVSTSSCSDAVASIMSITTGFGGESMYQILHTSFPALPTETQGLTRALFKGDVGKSRRILKKLAIAIP